MNVHDTILALAAASLDFPPTAAERQALDRHLVSCEQCRSDVAGVADDARRLASRPVPTLRADRAEAIRATLESPRRAASPAFLLVAVALLVLIALGTAIVGAQVIRRLDGPSLVVLPQLTPVPADPTPVPSASTASPSPAGAPLAVAWTAVGEPAIRATRGFEHSFLESDRGTMIQIRYLEGALTTIVAATRDGTTWTTDEVASSTIPAGIAVNGGADWMQIVTGKGGKLALWTSTDGLAWEQRGTLPAAVGSAGDSAVNGASILVCGTGTGARQDLAECALSQDAGRTWARVEDLGVAIDRASLRGIVPLGTGFLAVVEGDETGSVAYTSEDGLAWTRQDAPVPSSATAVATVGDTVVVRGVSDAAGTMAISHDGLTWETVDVPAADGIVFEFVRTGDVLLAPVVLVEPEGAARATGVLLSSDGRTWVAGGVPTEVAAWQNPTFLPVDGGVIVLGGDSGTMMLGTVTGARVP